MRKYYEKILKTVVDDYNQHRSPFTTIEKLNISQIDATFLTAKGLCISELQLDCVDCIQPTDAGITYFEDKKERFNNLFINWSFNFAMAVMSAACGSALTLLIQHAIR
jgi:hypothetical protein